ncbi:hypothetical protein [Pseudonocardia sp. WMMC193]|uniref:hypothetical protein n=1 Tax=Pseudonocardia sp. WMMC193 TaxID=2911965 RepID=UPI001F35765F|nr:hypothetical protein [Pseudonocardia sp. WMMC193]MCF7551213.1 hypothetical protein [Pseudonocardia sp. WMMC193]
MLKKAGIVVAGVAASLVALSPLAFAGEAHHEGGKHVGIDRSGSGLVNLSGNDANVPFQVCNNDVPVNAGVGAVQGNVKDLAGALTGAAALFGKSSASTHIATDTDRSCGQKSGAGDSL